MRKIVSKFALAAGLVFALAFNIYGCSVSGRDTLAFDRKSGLFVSDKTRCLFEVHNLGAIFSDSSKSSILNYSKAVLIGECAYYDAKITSLRQVTNLRTGQTIRFKKIRSRKTMQQNRSAGLFLRDLREDDEIIVDFKYK